MSTQPFFTQRGGLVELPTRPGGDIFFIPFLFNPKEFTESETQVYSKTVVPMWADPMVQYVGGAGTTFKFDIFLEEMRMREIFDRKRKSKRLQEQLGGKLDGGKQTITTRHFFFTQKNNPAQIDFKQDLEQYIKRIESLRYPKRSDRPGLVYVNSPPRVMVILGKFKRIGFIEKTTIKYTDLFPDGRIRSAVMNVDMILAFGRSAQESRFNTVGR